MKRLVALVSAIPLLAFVVGWTTGRRKTSNPSVPTPVAPAVVPIDPPLEGRFQTLRRWIATYRDILDPALVLIVAVIAAAATAGFAWWTNEINEQQGTLLEQQNEILARQMEVAAANSLPLFSATTPGDRDVQFRPSDSGPSDLPLLIISNEGGMARYANLEMRPEIHVIIEQEDNSRIAGPTIRADGLYFLPVDYGNPGLGQGEWDFYSVSDLNVMNDFFLQVRELVNGQYPDLEVGFQVRIYVRIEYTDYQGAQREEYFVIYHTSLGIERYSNQHWTQYIDLEPDYDGAAYNLFLRDSADDTEVFFYNVYAETIDQALAEDIALSIMDMAVATPSLE